MEKITFERKVRNISTDTTVNFSENVIFKGTFEKKIVNLQVKVMKEL